MKALYFCHILSSVVVAILASSSASFAQDVAGPIDQIAQCFADAELVSGPAVVDCTLSGSTKASCFSITVKADPQSYTPPTNVSDTAEAGGIWLRDGEVHDVADAFIANLAEFYGDAEW